MWLQLLLRMLDKISHTSWTIEFTRADWKEEQEVGGRLSGFTGNLRSANKDSNSCL